MPDAAPANRSSGIELRTSMRVFLLDEVRRLLASARNRGAFALVGGPAGRPGVLTRVSDPRPGWRRLPTSVLGIRRRHPTMEGAPDPWFYSERPLVRGLLGAPG